MRTLARLLLGIAVLLVAAWGGLALGIRLAAPAWLAQGAGALFFLAVVALLLAVRPLPAKVAALGVVFAALFAWWTSLAPSNDRDWSPEVALPPTAEVRGDILVVRNVRNFDYHSESDFDERWEERRYDLSRIRGVDLVLSYWGSPAIAHTIMSWDFGDGEHLAISIETRKERGEEYSAIRGFFREYELYYVVADERDLIRLRTSYRDEDVYVYRLRVPRAVARALLLDYVATMNELAVRPRWYNALVDNCTTGIRVHAEHVAAVRPWDWRLLANGYVDEILYERGRIDTELPFADLKAASDVVARARAADRDPDFSRRIRDGLPDPAAVRAAAGRKP